MITRRDVRINFNSTNFQLDLPNSHHPIGYSDSGLITFQKVNYEYKSLITDYIERLEAIIIKYKKGYYNIDNCKESILHLQSTQRAIMLPASYKNERESRIVAYVPKNLDEYPNIQKYISKKRTFLQNGEVKYRDEFDEKYIYINFDNEKTSFEMSTNPESDVNEEYFEKMIKNVGYNPIINRYKSDVDNT